MEKTSSFEIRINGRKFEMPQSKITGAGIIDLLGLNRPNDYEILLKITDRELEPVELDEVVDLTRPGIEELTVKAYETISIEIDDEKYSISEVFMNPKEIMALAGLDPENFYLKQIQGHKDITYKNDPSHMIGLRSEMKFSSCKIESTTVS